MNEYPEHEKMAAVREAADTISEFLDWLEGRHIHLAKAHFHNDACRLDGDIACGHHDGDLSTIANGNEQLLADHFGIDLKRIGDEKDQMLADMRRQTA